MKVFASQYLDNGEWGILTEDNRILVYTSVGLTEGQAKAVAEKINVLLAEVQLKETTHE